METPNSEGDFYRDIIRRSRRLRERAAESLRRTRETRRRQAGDAKEDQTAAPPRRRGQKPK